MNKNDLLKSVYDDFFGISRLERENEKLYRDIKKLKGIDIEGIEENMPSIEINKDNLEDREFIEKKDVNMQDGKIQLSKEDKDKLMENSFRKIDELYIKEESKELLKKIIEYMRKYSENLEKRFIAFNMCIYSNNKEIIEAILDILNQNINYFSYMKYGKAGVVSFYDIDKPEKLDEIYN